MADGKDRSLPINPLFFRLWDAMTGRQVREICWMLVLNASGVEAVVSVTSAVSDTGCSILKRLIQLCGRKVSSIQHPGSFSALSLVFLRLQPFVPASDPSPKYKT